MTGCGVPLPARANTSAMSKINVRPAPGGLRTGVRAHSRTGGVREARARMSCDAWGPAGTAASFGVRPAAECVMGELDGVARDWRVSSELLDVHGEAGVVYSRICSCGQRRHAGRGWEAVLTRRLAQMACERGYGPADGVVRARLERTGYRVLSEVGCDADGRVDGLSRDGGFADVAGKRGPCR